MACRRLPKPRARSCTRRNATLASINWRVRLAPSAGAGERGHFGRDALDKAPLPERERERAVARDPR
jgi:hypothetical protein